MLKLPDSFAGNVHKEQRKSCQDWPCHCGEDDAECAGELQACQGNDGDPGEPVQAVRGDLHPGDQPGRARRHPALVSLQQPGRAAALCQGPRQPVAVRGQRQPGGDGPAQGPRVALPAGIQRRQQRALLRLPGRQRARRQQGTAGLRDQVGNPRSRPAIHQLQQAVGLRPERSQSQARPRQELAQASHPAPLQSQAGGPGVSSISFRHGSIDKSGTRQAGGK